MLNPILAFSATRRMRSFRTMLIVIAYMAALLTLALVILGPFLGGNVYLTDTGRSSMAYLLLIGIQFGLLILIAPAMTSGAIAGERERRRGAGHGRSGPAGRHAARAHVHPQRRSDHLQRGRDRAGERLYLP